MLDVVTIAGSPAAPSRCAAALDAAREVLERRGLTTERYSRNLKRIAHDHGMPIDTSERPRVPATCKWHAPCPLPTPVEGDARGRATALQLKNRYDLRRQTECSDGPWFSSSSR